MATVITLSDEPHEFAGSEGTYLLPHRIEEIARLQTQHAFILASTRNTLVTAPLEGKRGVRVLDCGAADGTWLRDVRRIYPQHEWELYGLDIGSALFPPGSDRLGLHLFELDIRQGIPQALRWDETFDLVHQRLLIWALPRPEWPQVIERYRSLLKDDGWLQLVEGQWVDRDHDFDPLETPNLAKMSVMQRWSTSHFGMDIFIAYELEHLVETAGFRNVRKTSFPLGYGAEAKDPGWKQRSADMWIDTFRSLALKLPIGGIPGVARDKSEFLSFLEDLKTEILQHGYTPQLNLVIGQK